MGERALLESRDWQALGFDTGISQTPITPVMVGDEGKAQQLQRELFDEGVLALAIVFPTVGTGQGPHPHHAQRHARPRRFRRRPQRLRQSRQEIGRYLNWALFKQLIVDSS